jgi:hypothetical protein
MATTSNLNAQGEPTIPLTFLDEVSGITLQTALYYLMSDDGTPYRPEGFASIEDAKQWFAVSEWSSFGEPMIPKMSECGTGFEPVDAVNIFLGADLYRHYTKIMSEPLPSVADVF